MRISRLSMSHVIRALLLAVAGALLCLAPAGSARGASVYSVPVDIDGTCSSDVSQSLLTWIKAIPDNSVVSFASGACYRIEETLEITDRHGLTFEGNGATFEATTPGDGHRPQWRLIQGSNLTLRDMTIDGGDAQGGTFNAALQQQHGIELMGPSAVEIDHVGIANVYGDCVYVGQGYYNKQWSSDIHVHDSSCARSGRMGVAVTAGRNVLVERTSFTQIGMTVFDIEPNGVGFGATSVTFAGNQVTGKEMFDALGDGAVDSVTVSNNTITGQATHMAVIARPGQLHTNIVITGNVSDTAYSNAGTVAIDVVRVNGLTVTGNVIPLGAQNMALVDVSESCNVNVSHNTYSGGVAEARIHPYGGVCPALSPAVPAQVSGGGSAPAGTVTTATKPVGSAAAPGAAPSSGKVLRRATLSAPNPQTLRHVRRRGLILRLAAGRPAVWSLTATLRMTAKLHTTRLRAVHGRRVRMVVKAPAGARAVRLRIPRTLLKGLGMAVVDVRARVRSGGRSVERSVVVHLLAGAGKQARNGS
jgi:hypothetical protein